MLIRAPAIAPSPRCCAVAVMAKASAAGKTKTRLSPPLTPQQAADLNTAFLADVSQNLACAARHGSLAPFIAFSPANADEFFKRHLSNDLGLIQAVFPDFGDCLRHSISTLLELGFGAACVLNSDSPTLPTQILIDAADILNRPGERIVLGPSIDGGYYLLGVKKVYRELFDGIDWSTGAVLEQTQARATSLGISTVMLAPWYDVDDVASLQTLARETLWDEPFSSSLRSYEAAQSRAFLREHRLYAGDPNSIADGLSMGAAP